MRFRRSFFILLSVFGLLSFTFVAPSYAFQEDNVQDDGQLCLEEGGVWDGTTCVFPEDEWNEGPGEEWDEEQWC